MIIITKTLLNLVTMVGTMTVDQGWKKTKIPGFFGLNLVFFGLNQVFFQSHVCIFMNENSHVLEQLVTNINYYLI